MLTIKDLSARKDLDRAALSAVAGGFLGTLANTSSDLFAVLGTASQVDYTAITNFGNHGSLVLNIVDNDKDIHV